MILGGHGTSAPLNPDERATTFANNDGWHDDVSDGPVHATVRFPSGFAVEAQPGYVVVCPPKYAPGLFGAVTLLDVIDDLFVAGQPSGRCSFSAHIWPLFQRITDLQWTNHRLYVLTGLGRSPAKRLSRSALAVSSTMGIRLVRSSFLWMSHTFKPSYSGIITSLRMRSGTIARAFSIPSCPSAARVT